MQVDHKVPLQWGDYHGVDVDVIENLVPACRVCNHYKRDWTLEGYRSLLKTITSRLDKVYIYRVAKVYGIVSEHIWEGEFYFEKLEREHQEDMEHADDPEWGVGTYM